MQLIQNEFDLAGYIFVLLVFGMITAIIMANISESRSNSDSIIGTIGALIFFSVIVGFLIWLVTLGPSFCGESIGNFIGAFKRGYQQSSERND